MTDDTQKLPLLSPNDPQLDQAVRLACAFVANGDVRLAQGTNNADAYKQLEDLIVDMFEVVNDASIRILENVEKLRQEVQG